MRYTVRRICWPLTQERAYFRKNYPKSVYPDLLVNLKYIASEIEIIFFGHGHINLLSNKITLNKI